MPSKFNNSKRKIVDNYSVIINFKNIYNFNLLQNYKHRDFFWEHQNTAKKLEDKNEKRLNKFRAGYGKSDLIEF